MQQLLWKSLTTRANFRLSANLSNFMKRLKFSSGLVSSSNGRKGAIPSIGDDINDKAYLLSNVLTEGFLRGGWKMGLSAKSRFDCKDLARKKRCFYPESDSEQTSLLEINPVWSSVTYLGHIFISLFFIVRARNIFLVVVDGVYRPPSY